MTTTIWWALVCGRYFCRLRPRWWWSKDVKNFCDDDDNDDLEILRYDHFDDQYILRCDHFGSFQVWRSKPAVTRDVEDRLYSRFRWIFMMMIWMVVKTMTTRMLMMIMGTMMIMMTMTLAIIDCKYSTQLCTHEDPLLSSCIHWRRGETHHHNLHCHIHHHH